MSCAYEYGGRDSALEIWPRRTSDTRLAADVEGGGCGTGLAPVAAPENRDPVADPGVDTGRSGSLVLPASLLT